MNSIVALMLAFVSILAHAQVPPSSADITAYRGVHAAAHHGDIAALEELLATSRSNGMRAMVTAAPLCTSPPTLANAPRSRP